MSYTINGFNYPEAPSMTKLKCYMVLPWQMFIVTISGVMKYTDVFDPKREDRQQCVFADHSS